MPGSLDGLHLLVTRPAHQAEPLCQLLEQHGGHPIRFPTLEITALQNPAGLLPAQVDIVIFVSANAVNFGLPCLGRLPASTVFATVGKGTAQALEQHGITPGIVPHTQFDSEGLLAHPALQDLNGKQVVIVRGESGRNFLGDNLQQRGAIITYLPCYQRRLPEINPDNVLHQALQNRQLDIILIHSGEALQNLVTLCPAAYKANLLATPLAVIHPRQAELATQLGFKQAAIVSTQADDESLVEAVINWHHNQ